MKRKIEISNPALKRVTVNGRDHSEYVVIKSGSIYYCIVENVCCDDTVEIE